MTLTDVLMKFQQTDQTFFDYRTCAAELLTLAQLEKDVVMKKAYINIARQFVRESKNAPLWREREEA